MSSNSSGNIQKYGYLWYFQGSVRQGYISVFFLIIGHMHALFLTILMYPIWDYYTQTQCSSKSRFITHEIPILRIFFPELTQFHSNTDPRWRRHRIPPGFRPQIFTKTQTHYLTWVPYKLWLAWWRHQMESFSALLALCAWNSPVTGEFPSQRPVTRSFEIFFDLGLNKRLSKQSWGWWFGSLS